LLTPGKRRKTRNKEGVFMSTSTWVVMLFSWGIILFFTIKFLIKAIKTCPEKEN
jgi:hypothetical protein